MGKARRRWASLPTGVGHAHRGSRTNQREPKLTLETARPMGERGGARGNPGRGHSPPRGPGRAHLQSTDGSALEAQICLEVLSNFTHQTLEGELADQKFGGLLIAPDFTQSHSTRPIEIRYNGKKNNLY